MAPTPGGRFGPYEILAPIGAGGMGEVFKARDTRLGRTVAIKVSAGRFTERFEREARAVAALSHPNVCTLYDVGPDYLVMEYIDGRPLKGPLPIETVLRYAREIAGALDAAHRLNIIHRDLKPANILVTKSGVKLLDFGLAKMNAPLAAPDETVTRALTEEGAILGTLQYMSPEQLEGKDADARSDIFAFGCVLYEMITGRMAFQGESKASIIAAILEREPQPMTGVPAALAKAIQRAMAKDPDERWQSARDLAGVLDLAAIAPEAATRTQSPKLAIAVLAGVVLISSAAALWFALRTPAQSTWSGEPLGGPPAALGPRVSPDGHTIAFQAMIDGQTQVGILKPETGNWTVLTHQKDLGQINDLSWSRDGSKIYFDRQTDGPAGIFVVPALGGEPRLVLESAANPQLFADGSFLVSRINARRDLQLYRFWPNSGKVEPLPAIMDTSGVTAARTTPDGKHVLYFGYRLDSSGARLQKGIFALNPVDGTTHQLAPGAVLQYGSAIAVAATPDGRSAIISVPAGSAYRVIEVPLTGGASQRTLVTLTKVPWYLDVAPDGSVYIDQLSTSETLLRFSAGGGKAERLSPSYAARLIPVAVLKDGRPLIYTDSGTKKRLVIVEPDGRFAPLIESDENCGLPAALIGDRHVAVMTDRKGEIAIVSIADGRITSRVPVQHEELDSLTASPDGKTFYFTSGRFVWSMPITGGTAIKLGSGDSVAADPNGHDLIVSLAETEATRLVRMPVSGGAATPIEAKGDLRMASSKLATRAARPDGRIAVYAAAVSQWSYLAAIIDPRAQTISRVPLDFDGEVALPVWTPDGRLIAAAKSYTFTLWRFQQDPH
jgi:Tol biopolymer transport system component/predicted Ser/Thr protein kinase